MSRGGEAVRMRVTSVPAGVYRYLLPAEHTVLTVRFHPARFVPPLATAIGALFFTVAVSPVMHGAAEVGAWLITLLLIGNLARTALDWFSRYLVITANRIFLCDASGITLELPLADVKGVRLTRTLGGRLLGYGTLIFDSAHLAIDSLPYPDQLYLEVEGMLHKNVNAGDHETG